MGWGFGERLWNLIREPVEETVKAALENLLGDKLLKLVAYLQNKKSKFRAAIVAEWKERGLTKADDEAADAALDAVVKQIS